MNATITVRAMVAADWPAVDAIYRAGIDSGQATFEAAPPEWREFDASRLADVRLSAVDEAGTLLGWAAASATSVRSVYRGVIEHSVYVDPAARGRGVGRALLEAPIRTSEAAGYWTIQSGIFPENTISLALHESVGFRRVGTRTRIAEMTYGPHAGSWRDVVLVERRSTLTGTAVRS